MVSAERLAQLNGESAACISRWGISVAQNAELGRYLVSATGVLVGETVMVLPPNLIQSFAEVKDYNTVIQARPRCSQLHRCFVAELRAPQVRYSAHLGERLYSASLTAEDLDNFLSHR